MRLILVAILVSPLPLTLAVAAWALLLPIGRKRASQFELSDEPRNFAGRSLVNPTLTCSR